MSDKMKSYPIIMQPFSIAGIKKQWEWQQSDYIVKHGMKGGPIEGQEHHFKKIKGLFHPEQIGCKTVTRRLTGLKAVNENPDEWIYRYWAGSPFKDHSDGKGGFDYPRHDFIHKSNSNVITIKCPYGVLGYELWVRESFAYTQFAFAGTGNERGLDDSIIYKADDPDHEWDGKYKSPLFMPRKASRITLINEGVTVERLHDITEEGAMMEGCIPRSFAEGDDCFDCTTPKRVYKHTWIAMHGEESWHKNHFVWVVKFSVKEFKNV